MTHVLIKNTSINCLENPVYKKTHHPHEAPLSIHDANGKKTRNPNGITVKQHVIPQAHLKEWSREDGLLNVFDKQKKSWITPAPHDAFTVQRLWDQWTEQTFLGTNERNYQNQATLIKSSQPIENNEHISGYFVMLCIRAFVAARERPDYPPMMELPSQVSTQSELEDIELQNVRSPVHLSYPGEGSSQSSARETVKLSMNMMFLQRVRKFTGVVWTPFDMSGEDAILPDSLIRIDERGLAILPVTPKIVLIGSRENNSVPSDASLTSTAINQKLISSSVRYYVASNQTSS